MMLLTKIRRGQFIDHVMPSDLDKEDIKHGLYLKEKMLSEITDENIRKELPNWRDLERQYKKNGLEDYIEKITCGEMTLNDVPQPNAVNVDVWMRWKMFNTEFDSDTKKYDFELYDNWPTEFPKGSDWIKFNNYVHRLEFPPDNDNFRSHNLDILIQFKIVIYGDDAIRYYPYQSFDNESGWTHVSNGVDMWFPHLFEREEDVESNNYNLLKYEDPITKEIFYGTDAESALEICNKQENFYRLFFRHKYMDLFNFEYDFDKDKIDNFDQLDDKSDEKVQMIEFKNYLDIEKNILFDKTSGKMRQYKNDLELLESKNYITEEDKNFKLYDLAKQKVYEKYRSWFSEETEFNKIHYPQYGFKNINTLYTDAYRIKIDEKKFDPNDGMIHPTGFYGCTLAGKQWIKRSWHKEMLNLVTFDLQITNDITTHPLEDWVQTVNEEGDE